MVLCWIALPVFAVLGIFSVRYRKLTLDSLDCMFRTVTLRKCSSGLDDKIRADVTGTFLKFSPRTAKFFYKNYKIISFIIMALFLVSSYFTAVGTYNYVKYGNCNGPESDGFCIFDPLGTLGDDNESLDNLASDLGIERTKLEGCLYPGNHTSIEECAKHCDLT